VSRADIAHIRGTDSAGVIDTLVARKLIADDARFGRRGRPAFLLTTDGFLKVMGLSSLAELPARGGAHRRSGCASDTAWFAMAPPLTSDSAPRASRLAGRIVEAFER
jgi:segregation and condensation protein B